MNREYSCFETYEGFLLQRGKQLQTKCEMKKHCVNIRIKISNQSSKKSSIPIKIQGMKKLSSFFFLYRLLSVVNQRGRQE